MFYRASSVEYLEKRGVAVVRLAGRQRLEFVVGGRPKECDFSDSLTLDVIILFQPGYEPKAIAPADLHVVDEYIGFNQ